MTNTLITGGNKGLGFETARRLIALGHTVYLGARDPEKGAAAAKRRNAERRQRVGGGLAQVAAIP